MIADRGPNLVEAAKYIERFRDRIVIVKLGGELLDGGPVLDRILPQVAVLWRVGLRPVIVHGGGRQVDAACADRGITPQKLAGRRITTPEVMTVIEDVVAGDLNQGIAARLRAEGVPTRDFSDGVSAAIRCVRRPPSSHEGERVEWGEVGDVIDVDASVLCTEDAAWSVPVLPSVGQLEDGSWVNVNADTVAARLAASLGATKVVLLTSVAGVMADPTAAGPISELTASQCRAIIAQGVAQGGMRAKIEEALKAIEGGVPRVHIISGRDPYTLLREIFTDEGCGTLVVPDAEVS